jgi:hypothetical protein
VPIDLSGLTPFLLSGKPSFKLTEISRTKTGSGVVIVYYHDKNGDIYQKVIHLDGTVIWHVMLNRSQGSASRP